MDINQHYKVDSLGISHVSIITDSIKIQCGDMSSKTAWQPESNTKRVKLDLNLIPQSKDDSG